MIPIECPVHVVHGTSDDVVPYENSLKLLDRLSSTNKGITLVQGGTHYLDVSTHAEKFTTLLHPYIHNFSSPKTSKANWRNSSEKYTIRTNLNSNIFIKTIKR